MKNAHFHWLSTLFPVFLFACWALAAAVVNPIGDFPLNDDFSFGRTAFNLVEKNQFLFDEWLSMTLVTQVLWGGAFCKIFGFSFTTLRFSTWVLALIGLLAFYKTGRELGQRQTTCLFASLVLAFNPLFFSLSYTFMSDVPFASMLMVSTLFFVKFFKNKKSKWLVWATLFALLATFVRQLGLMLPLSFAIVWLLGGRGDKRQALTALLPLVIIGTALFFYQKWFAASQGIPETYGTFSKLFKRVDNAGFWIACWERVGLLLIYMGFFLLPIHILFIKKSISKKGIFLTLFFIGLGLWAMLTIWHRFPWGNVLYNLGLGPKVLKDGYFSINVYPSLPTWGTRGIAIIGMLGGVLLIANLVGWFSRKNQLNANKLVGRFALVNIVVYGGFLLLDVYFFDRYFIPLIMMGVFFLLSAQPFLLSSANRKWPNCFVKYAALSFFLLIAAFSVAATHDYLSWNRARWQALHFLTHEKSISPNQIDGGFEFNGWHKTKAERNENSPKSWWWVDEDDYVVTFGKMDGFEKMKGYPYQRFLPPGVDSVFILKNNGSLTNPVE